MPLIDPSTYKAPLLFASPHIQTIWHSEFRAASAPPYRRDILDTPDGDCITIDWVANGGSRAALVLHGLESSSKRPYMRGMVAALHARGFDCAAMNFRGCGGGLNRTGTMYNAGATADLHTAVGHLAARGYREIVLCGFSLGGNIVLKYAGEQAGDLNGRITCCAAVSAPVDLTSAAAALERPSSFLYNRRFVKKLCRKVRAKAAAQPGSIDAAGLARVRTLRDYDELYTAPLGGYAGASEYYEKASSRPFIPAIAVPALLVNAFDDPFLGQDCYPFEEAHASRTFYLECPRRGGHIGFMAFNNNGEYWHETRVAEFLSGGNPAA